MYEDRTMKKLIKLLLVITLVLYFTGCVNITINTPQNTPSPTPGEIINPTPDNDPVPTPETLPTPVQDEIEWAEGDRLFGLYSDWAKLVGYWNTVERQFAVLDMEDSHSPVFKTGVWESGGGRDYGRVTKLARTAEMEITAEVYYPRQAADEMSDGYREMTELIVVDYSGKERDGKIRMKIGDGDFLQYKFAGWTSQEAYIEYQWDYYGE